MMSKALRLLILEDVPLDAELEINVLEEAGYTCMWNRVETKDGFIAALHNAQYDLILADYNLPAFDGLTALKLYRQHNLDIPFILVSGALGEEIAIESLKAGATDYVLKSRLERLAPVVERALREKEDQRRRKEAEAELHKLSQAVEQSPVSIIITDADGHIEYTNPKFSQITGYSPEEVVGETPSIFKDSLASDNKYQDLWKTILVGQSWHGEFHNKKKNGEFFWESAKISPIKDNANNITHFLAIMEDITERKRVEKQVREQDRLAAVGQLAAGIAHDFNNILAVISLYSDLLMLMSPPLASEAKKKIEVISNQSQQAADLIQQILDFSRRTILELTSLDLLIQLEELLKLWTHILPENIQIEFNYALAEYNIHADPTRIQQLFMNLVINARDAMPQGGKLDVCLNRFSFMEKERLPVPEMSIGEWIRIKIADNGTGILPKVLPHLFEPFFTTKEVGKGTGLGLAQVYGIVKQHQGHIVVKSEVDVGTSFLIYLPALPILETSIAIVEVESSSMGQGELVLLVEDNDVVRQVLIDSLDMLGYGVVAVENGRLAIAILEERGDEIDLVLSDMVMPEMGGAGLFYALKELLPAMKMVLIVGNPLSEDIETLISQGLHSWIQKPVQLHELGTHLAKVLGK